MQQRINGWVRFGAGFCFSLALLPAPLVLPHGLHDVRADPGSRAAAVDSGDGSLSHGVAEAMRRCLARTGRTGDSVGEISLDPETGKATYRCLDGAAGVIRSPDGEGALVPVSSSDKEAVRPTAETAAPSGEAASSAQTAPAEEALDPALRSVWLQYCLGAGFEGLRYSFCREAVSRGDIPSLSGR